MPILPALVPTRSCFAGLMPGGFEFTDTCRQIAHVTNGKAGNPATTRQEVFAQGDQIVSQRGSESHASDNNTFVEIIHYWSRMLVSNSSDTFRKILNCRNLKQGPLETNVIGVDTLTKCSPCDAEQGRCFDLIASRLGQSSLNHLFFYECEEIRVGHLPNVCVG